MTDPTDVEPDAERTTSPGLDTARGGAGGYGRPLASACWMPTPDETHAPPRGEQSAARTL